MSRKTYVVLIYFYYCLFNYIYILLYSNYNISQLTVILHLAFPEYLLRLL